MFFLAYHLNWGVEEILGLPTEERWHYLRQLTGQLEGERDAIEAARRR
ncbi:hypothetical protein AGRA3207_002108 [Actinomadura graeca]|uniref:Uncharacterized protein n=1 Tax=Actinomadura graeca TaxID=2750812 RepID=A0ABX8QRE3_9ACTN|nr:hypothetical protein [Actinomadura graeca]QXJ21271.1 hypothetical protein AGRA3207_002108 [Actinomadura graeca]